MLVDIRNANASAVKFNSKKFCIKFMWQIPLRECYCIHDG